MMPISKLIAAGSEEPSTPPSGLVIEAHALSEALKPAKAKLFKKEPCTVELSYIRSKGLLEVKEAKYETFTNFVPATGLFPSGVQMSGLYLQKVVATYPKGASIELRALNGFLEIHSGRSKTTLQRLDGTASAVKPKPLPTDKRHKGKVEPRLEGRHLRQRGNPWGFSANTPFKANKLDGDEETED